MLTEDRLGKTVFLLRVSKVWVTCRKLIPFRQLTFDSRVENLKEASICSLSFGIPTRIKKKKRAFCRNSDNEGKQHPELGAWLG